MTTVSRRQDQFGPFRVDTGTCQLERDSQPVALPPKAFDVLRVLIEAAGRVVTKEDLMKILWPETFVGESNLTQTIFVLRKALGETGGEPNYVVTVAGRGYRFAATFTEVVADERPAPTAAAPIVSAANEVRPAGGPVVATPGRWILGSLIGVAMMGAAVVTGYIHRTAAALSNTSSGARVMLAVLPFENLTGDPAQDYFSDGLTDEMITLLGPIDPSHLGVIARSSVERYKGSPAHIALIGAELGVQYVMEGAVRRNVTRVRITARLIRVVDQSELWAHEYDRDLGDLLAVQSEIGRAIANRVDRTLGEPGPAAASRTAPTMTPEAYDAYDLYLKGRDFWNKRTAHELLQAIEYFQQSIAKDPGSARSYAGLADAYTMLASYYLAPPDDSMPKARTAALRAVEIDDSLAEAHTSLALIAETYDWDWPAAEREYRRAIALNPAYTTAHHWWAECLMFEGRFDEALAESERARLLDPLSSIVAADNGAILFFARRYDRSIEQFRAVLDKAPFFPRAYLITSAYLENGQSAEALATANGWPDAAVSPWTLAVEARIFNRTGQQARAQRAVEKLERLNQGLPLDPGILIFAYVSVDRYEDAFVQLERAYRARSISLVTMKVDPAYDPIRHDPRFVSVLHRVGLDDAAPNR